MIYPDHRYGKHHCDEPGCNFVAVGNEKSIYPAHIELRDHKISRHNNKYISYMCSKYCNFIEEPGVLAAIDFSEDV